MKSRKLRIFNKNKGRVQIPVIFNQTIFRNQVISFERKTFALGVIFKKILFLIRRSKKKQKLIWTLTYLPFYLFTKKTKNSRMGKGRGKKKGTFIQTPVGGVLLTMTSAHYNYNKIKTFKLASQLYKFTAIGI